MQSLAAFRKYGEFTDYWAAVRFVLNRALWAQHWGRVDRSRITSYRREGRVRFLVTKEELGNAHTSRPQDRRFSGRRWEATMLRAGKRSRARDHFRPEPRGRQAALPGKR